MATSAFKSTTKRAPIATSSPSTDNSPSSSSSHRRSRSLSRFSRPLLNQTQSPTPTRNDFPEISLDDLAVDFFSSELDDTTSASSRRDRVKSEIKQSSSQRRSRSVSRHPDGADSVVAGGVSVNLSSHRRGRSVSRRNDGNVTAFNGVSTTRAVSNGDLRRRRSVSVARHQISDSESDIDFSRSSASQPKSRSTNNGNGRVASFQRPTASSHQRLTRSMSQAPQLRSRDGYLSQSSALTDEDLRDARYGSYEIEKTIRAMYAQKKPEKRKQDLSTKRALEEQKPQDGYKIVREVVPKLKSNTKAQAVSYPRKRSNDRNRMSKRLNEEAEKYFEDFISNIEDTDFSSFDGERSDTSSTLFGSTTKQNGVPVEMEGINLPWLKWEDNNGVHPTTLKTKLWDPAQDLQLIQGQGNLSSSSHGSWNPEHTPANSTELRIIKSDQVTWAEKYGQIYGTRGRKLKSSFHLLQGSDHLEEITFFTSPTKRLALQFFIIQRGEKTLSGVPTVDAAIGCINRHVSVIVTVDPMVVPMVSGVSV
ncbi:hypothetical protein QVD17_16402 [Tagetes erecta]|uniref:Uncharacterized protein n=1 Tax=Tagetes erecta TaxID=13708 RepID=A0AAD8KQU4_TARER|nr:hypothetical protein QVD17_16402 [Tagetes erecta]